MTSGDPAAEQTQVPARRNGRKRLSNTRKVTYSFVVLCGVLVALELGLRVGNRLWTGRWDFMPRTRFAAELYEPHPYICYTMGPNRRVEGYGGVVETNQWGLRSPQITKEKPDGVIRIACLGASTTFCLNASDNRHTWPTQLEAILSQRYAPRKFEVLNFGTPGYCVVESFLIFALRGVDFEPNLVLFQHAWNDVPPISRSDLRSDYSHFRTFYPRGDQWMSRLALGRSIVWLGASFGCVPYSGPYDRIREGTDLFLRYVDYIASVARSRIIEPVVITLPDALPSNRERWKKSNDTIMLMRELIAAQREFCKKERIQVIDLAAEFPKEPRLFTDNAHKTDEGLRLAAQMIADALAEQGVLQRVFNRAALTQRK